MLNRQGAVIPQATVDLFAAQEAKLQEEAAALEVGEIPYEYLSLSPLILPFKFLNEHTLDELNAHGSNVDFIGSKTIADLQASEGYRSSSAGLDPVMGEASTIQDNSAGGVVENLVELSASSLDDLGEAE